jgi:hypothetical protein
MDWQTLSFFLDAAAASEECPAFAGGCLERPLKISPSPINYVKPQHPELLGQLSQRPIGDESHG